MTLVGIRRRKRRANEGKSFGDWRNDHFGHAYSSAASPSQGQDQEEWAARLQREKRKRQILWRPFEALVLLTGCDRAGLRRRGKSLGCGRRGLPLRTLPDALFAESRGRQSECRGAGNDLGFRVDAAAERESTQYLVPSIQ